MKILVAVRRVIDPYVKIRIKPDQSDVERSNTKMAMNPFDEIAVEAALRLRETGKATEVILVSVGDTMTQDILRHGLALGADRAILVQTSARHCSLNIAKLLQVIVLRETPSLVLMGKQSIDGDNNQTPQMLAALLGWPQGTYASVLALETDNIKVTREVDGGLETLTLRLPAVISTDLRLNEPRYATLPNIMKAKQKPLMVIPEETLEVFLTPRIERLSIRAPSVRTRGVKVDSVCDLIEKLQHEGLL